MKYNVDIVNKTSVKEVENIQVHVTLHGEKGDSGKRVLIKSTEGKEKLFQEGTVSKVFISRKSIACESEKNYLLYKLRNCAKKVTLS